MSMAVGRALPTGWRKAPCGQEKEIASEGSASGSSIDPETICLKSRASSPLPTAATELHTGSYLSTRAPLALLPFCVLAVTSATEMSTSTHLPSPSIHLVINSLNTREQSPFPLLVLSAYIVCVHQSLACSRVNEPREQG